MKRVLSVSLVLVLMCGCDVIQQIINGNPPPTINVPGLKAFESEQELREYFRSEITSRNDLLSEATPPRDEEVVQLDGTTGAAPAPQAPPSAGGDGAADTDSATGAFSGTTIQEIGVDEADVLKTDGTYLYLIDGGVLRIVQISPPEQLAYLGDLALAGYGQEIYLHDNKVVAITATFGGTVYLTDDVVVQGDGGVAVGDAVAEEPAIIAIDSFAPYYYERPKTTVTVVDVSDPRNPSIVSQTDFDGSQSSNRMIDGVLHLILANYQDYYFDVMPLLGRPTLDVASVDTDSLIPTYHRVEADGTVSSGNVLDYSQLYRPEEPDGFGVVSLVSMDIDNAAQFNAVGVVAEPGLIYSSLEAMYLTNTSYDFTNTARATTNVYKFRYQGRGAVPSSTGEVPGRILNQYSMGEYQGNLRVATTIDPTWVCDEVFCGQFDESTNNVYVLSELNGELQIAGRIENIATGETIQSARFLGARGFLVTFEQIDPLFTLDLADAANPRIVGELKVPGFSTYMVPIDENHLLTVGQYIPDGAIRWPTGVQLSIFDVTDFAQPVLAHQEIITDANGAYSEALWNPKAFTYFAEGGIVALPVNIYGGPIFSEPFPIEGDGGTGSSGEVKPTEVVDGGETVVVVEAQLADGSSDVGGDFSEPYIPQGFDGLYVYAVSTETGFVEKARISTRFDATGYYYPYMIRGIFVEGDVFAVSNLGIRAGSVSALPTTPFELAFPVPVPIVEPPILVGPTEPQPIAIGEPNGSSEPGGVVDPNVMDATTVTVSPAGDQ